MTAHQLSDESRIDPETLRSEVEFIEETHTFDPEEFDSLQEDLAPLDGWVVVGLTNDSRKVLLMNDGDHGWTLPNVSVREGDWLARAGKVIEGLTGIGTRIEAVERVRRLDYVEETGDRSTTVHHVVLRAESVSGTPLAETPTVGCDGEPDAGWFETLPEEAEGVTADDARLFV